MKPRYAPILIACDATGKPPEWIHMVPMGAWDGHPQGQMFIDQAKCEQIIANFNAEPTDLVIDWEHQTLEAEYNGEPAPAAGWGKELQLREDGVWGRVEWTPRGDQSLANKEYRYFSPVLEFHHWHWQTGQDVGCYLHSGGLTNTPFMRELKPIMNRAPNRSNMDSTLKDVVALVGLPADATADQIKTSVLGLVAFKAAVIGQLGLTNTATGQEAEASVVALKNKGAAAEDEQLIAAAIREGRITPAQEPVIRAAFKSDRGTAVNFLKTAPVVVPVTTPIDKGREAAGNTQLTPAERAVCKQTGVDKDTYLKARNGSKA